MKPKLTTVWGMAFVLALLLTVNGHAQEFKMKYGDIDPENLQMTSFRGDTSVAGMVIGDFGDVSFIFNQTDRAFKIVYKRHTRIKIFNKKGYSFADHEIRYYTDPNVKESVSRIKASTYNMVNGKMEETKIGKKGVFKEEISENWNRMSFTLPDVREGSIIEYEYTVTSDRLFYLPVWYFQQSIPVLWSEYTVEAPEYYYYRQLGSGYEQIDINEIRTGSGSFSITDSERYSLGTEFQTSNYNYATNKYRMVGIDVPPFITEPMLTTRENYILKMKFEMQSRNLPGRPSERFTESWESLIIKLMENSYFGEQFEADAYLNDALKEIESVTTDPMQKMTMIYEHVKGRMKWNEYNSIYATSTLRNAYRDETGSAADINLILTLMLQKAGFQAKPVILSTRAHGMINKFYPLFSSFNYVIALVDYDGRRYLLDATDKFCTFNLLPFRCLNGDGLIVDKTATNWAMLNPTASHDAVVTLAVSLDDAGDIEGTWEALYKDYAAYEIRSDIDAEKSEDDYIKGLEDDYPGLEIEEYRVENLTDVYSPVKESYDFILTGKSTVAGDLIYLNPLFSEQMDSNPFKLEDRKYPIDFGHPVHDVLNVSITIPEGYTVDEMPADKSLNLADGSATFSYKTTVADKVITLTNEVHINKALFVYDDYAGLKEFFNKVVAKHAEMVVLKKVAGGE